MLAKGGRVKVVDFGLAKATGASHESAGQTVTAPHAIAGTPAYMSPEHARGDAVDFRSDIFSFGSMLYEMVTGERAFDRPSSIDTLSAILHDEPRPMSEVAQNVPADLQRIVQRCLAKSPDDRYGSTADLLHDLRWLKDHPTPQPAFAMTDRSTRSSSRRAWPWFGALATTMTAFALGWTLNRPGANVPAAPEFPRWQKLTFEEGYVHSARFSPDSQTILYSASWGGKPFQVYSTTSLSPESRPLDLPPAGLLGVSRTGQLALSLGCAFQQSNTGCRGTLATAPLLGGAPRPLSDNVAFADWAPDDVLATVVGGRLEFPPGKTIAARVQHVRISPDGQRLAWTEQRAGRVAMMLREGVTTRALAENWEFISGLAWSPDSRAIFVSGRGPDNLDDAISKVEIDGTTRVVVRAMTRLRILDTDARGRLLVDRSDSATRGWIRDARASSGRREISWLGDSVVDALSEDGRTALMTVRGGPTLMAGRDVDLYPIYLRPTTGGAATFLGIGYGAALSPDGRWALTRTRKAADSQYILYPLGLGTPLVLDRGGLNLDDVNPRHASFAGNDRIAFPAATPDGSRRTYIQSITGGPPTPVAHEPGEVISAVAPDGNHFISERRDGSLWLAAFDGTASHRLPFTLQEVEFITQWTADSRQVFVVARSPDRWVVTRRHLKTGTSTHHADVMRDPLTHYMFASAFYVSRDGSTIVYSDTRIASALFLVEGVK